MKTISINEAFQVKFIYPLHSYENVLIILRRLHFEYDSKDVTKEGRKEIEFTVQVKNVHEASFLETVINRL